MREANISYSPETDEVLVWNVGLYDTETADELDSEGYVISVGAMDHAEAQFIADEWTKGRKTIRLPDGTLIYDHSEGDE